MNIDKPDSSLQRPGIGDRPQTNVTKQPGKSAPSAAAPAPQAELTISSGMQALIASGGTEPFQGVDQARVESIRSAIEQGTYHVDPERLAERFLDLESLIDQ